MIVIAGSRDLWPTPNVASAILSIMVSHDTPVGVRGRGRSETSSMVEDLVVRIADRIAREVLFYPSVSGNWHRDNQMMRMADELFAFFAPGKLMEGGTGHLVNVALRIGTPVKAFELDGAGNVVEAASDEGDLLSMYKEGDT